METLIKSLRRERHRKEDLEFIRILLDTLISGDFERLAEDKELLFETIDEMYKILRDAMLNSKDENLLDAFEHIAVLRALINYPDLSPLKLLKDTKHAIDKALGD
ncbi:hypothetical protein PAP_07470 [Palaeococcus pacificus DY20341]|uniref:Uncharacterized protein n=1 Tax=Palaeococcus pacificus DY20341 TaxID=1343739 RepID=A0A075LU35_9EURY|nr:hypothetical protein [Palaeococcus pacificus]AIF69884.1 hypothetical protein PAP_07470 [Palaeococcus pacificus DY20341]